MVRYLTTKTMKLLPSEKCPLYGICEQIWEYWPSPLVKIEFLPEKASTKFKYCMRKL